MAGDGKRGGQGLIGDDAVVIGGSMAGLLAARALADRFARVTVVERDRLPVAPAFRKGVPHSRHLHVLLGRGCAVLERLFPGFEAELLAAGAVPVRWPADALWLTPHGWSGRFDQGFRLLSASRELIEWAVRRRVAALANVHLLEGQEAVELTAGADGAAVTGVRRRARPSAAGDAAGDLAATLVVDASGRNSRAPEWLADLGYAPPAETTIDASLAYASRTYAISPGFAPDWKLLYLQAKPPAFGRGGGLFPIEGGRWLVTLAGVGGDDPPTDEAGFLAFARTLRSPILAETIRAAVPLSPIHGYRRTENRRRHYERLRRLPAGFLVTGDALCAFNPIYGQGMTAAAQDALILSRLLAALPNGDLAGLGHRFHRRVARANAGAWLIATGEDLRYPTTAGGSRSLATRLSHAYLDRVIRAATVDPAVNLAFLNVLQLIAPPRTLFAPRVALAALRGVKPTADGPLPAGAAAPPAADAPTLVPAGGR